MRKLQLVLLLFACFFLQASAQGNKITGIVRGKVVTGSTVPANSLKVSIPSLNIATVTDGDGNFEFSKVPFGTYNVVISAFNIKNETVTVTVNKAITEMEEISVEPNENGISTESSQIPTIRLEENNASSDDEGQETQVNNGGPVYTGRDPFIYTSSFILSYYSFKPRGYGFAQMETEINGIPINDIESRTSPFGQLNLTDVFHERNIAYGLGPSEYMFGGVGGSEYIDASAAGQRKETRVSYRYSDGVYKNRVMFTQNSGLMENGWAYSVSVSKRWATEGYVPGTYYDGYSFYGAVSKVAGRHQFNFITFGSPTERGKSRATTREADSLASSNYYNPDWGYQSGVKRNANVENIFQPQFILNDAVKLSENTRYNFSVGYQFGKKKNSFIDYYNGTPYQPDYYTKLPSYYLQPPNYYPALADSLRSQYIANPQLLQINWADLYSANKDNLQTVQNVNGIAGNSYTGLQSVYVLANDVNDIKKWSFNANLQHVVNPHISIYTGITEISQSTENYTQLSDLLGGDFFVNYNSYAASTYPGNNQYIQYNLKEPNQILRVGDKYGFDYTINQNKGWWWGQGTFDYNTFNFFIAGSAGINEFNRVGLMQNGLFPQNSYGASDAQSFLIYSAKGGVKLNANSHNSLFINAEYKTDAPTVENAYTSPKESSLIGGSPLTDEIYKSLEGGYTYKSSKLEARITGYVTDIDNARKISRYYNDAVDQKAFTDYIMDGLGMRYVGTEMVISFKVTSAFTITGVASIGQAFYTKNPKISIYQDDDPNQLVSSDNVYIKNYYLSTGPQTAYTLGLNYRFSKNFYATLNFNYLDNNYIDISIDRRSDQSIGLFTPGSAQWNTVLTQEKLPSAFTTDLRVGKSFQLSKSFKIQSENTILFIDGQVKNLLNNTDVINYGYEQLRYDFTFSNPYKFPNKYIYGYGINLLINIGLKF